MAVICFDYDGTLADTISLEEQYYLPAFRRRGIEVFQTMNDLKEACRVNYYAFCAEHDLSDELLEEILAEFKAALAENNIEEPLFPGVVEMLTALLPKHLVYIVSANDADFIRRRFASEGLTDFAGIIGWKESMSKEESLRRLLKEHDGEPFYFVSDSVGDISEAVSVGVPHIYGVSYGWGIGADLIKAGAHRLFDDVPSLAARLGEAE